MTKVCWAEKEGSLTVDLAARPSESTSGLNRPSVGLFRRPFAPRLGKSTVGVGPLSMAGGACGRRGRVLNPGRELAGAVR